MGIDELDGHHIEHVYEREPGVYALKELPAATPHNIGALVEKMNELIREYNELAEWVKSRPWEGR